MTHLWIQQLDDRMRMTQKRGRIVTKLENTPHPVCDMCSHNGPHQKGQRVIVA